MPINVLIVGSDLSAHKLVTDILEITFNNTKIEKATNAQTMLDKFKTQHYKYDLLILDLQISKKDEEVLILNLRSKYPHLFSRMILLLDSVEEKPEDTILQNISYIIKPFSLDEFGDLVKKICIEKE